MNRRAGVQVKLHKIRTSALDGRKRSGPRHDRFHPTEMTPAAHSTGRQVSPQGDVDVCYKEEL
jgi:hypothetical protein